MVRPPPTRRDRVRVAAGIVLGLGLVIYLYSAYHAFESSGLSTTSELGNCAEAATGTFDPSYRGTEILTVSHGFFPPSATCHWSGGTEAYLVAPTWTWSGIVLVALAVVTLIALRIGGPRLSRR